jgi:hypothetical protein
MKPFIVAVLGIALCGGTALADSKPSTDEAGKLKDVVTAWGCEGGTFEKETEASGVFEADDVKCKAGNYDFKIDGAYKVISITAD